MPLSALKKWSVHFCNHLVNVPAANLCLTPILFLLLSFSHVDGTEYQPWLGNIYEFEFRSSFLYQGYSKITTGSSLKNFSSNDIFLNASLANALPSQLGIELELTQARTRRQKGRLDRVKTTGRYVLWDDIAGDPLSFTAGISYIQAFRQSLRDISSFHHGLYEGEAFLSVGKEIFFDTKWGFRWWSVFGVGCAEKGSPWLRVQFAYEKWIGNVHELRVFLHSLWGLGHKNLHVKGFNGYGPVDHQSVDIGLKYSYLLEYFGNVSLEYSFRVHAQNFPAYTHHVLLQILYTFGL